MKSKKMKFGVIERKGKMENFREQKWREQKISEWKKNWRGEKRRLTWKMVVNFFVVQLNGKKVFLFLWALAFLFLWFDQLLVIIRVWKKDKSPKNKNLESKLLVFSVIFSPSIFSDLISSADFFSGILWDF